MHDPMTVAFDIKYPWFRDKPWPKGVEKWDDLTESQRRGRTRAWRRGYRDTFITIWHVDPESDGTDDSCGWSFSKLGSKEKKVVKEMVDWESKVPYYFSCLSYVHNPKYQYLAVSPGDCLSLCISGIAEVAWKLDERRMDRGLLDLAIRLATSPVDNLQSSFAAEGKDSYQIENAKRGAFRALVRCYISERRRWWQHPRWHFRHWKFQIHPLQDFKRWAFSRCSKCGKGFKWGGSRISGSWNGGGPRWFRTEENTWHGDCDKAEVPSVRTGTA